MGITAYLESFPCPLFLPLALEFLFSLFLLRRNQNDVLSEKAGVIPTSSFFLRSLASSLRSSSFRQSSSCDSQVILPEEMGVTIYLALLEFPSFVFFLLTFRFLLPPNLLFFLIAFEVFLPLFPLQWVRMAFHRKRWGREIPRASPFP